jgi:hypothetical protein
VGSFSSVFVHPVLGIPSLRNFVFVLVMNPLRALDLQEH